MSKFWTSHVTTRPGDDAEYDARPTNDAWERNDARKGPFTWSESSTRPGDDAAKDGRPDANRRISAATNESDAAARTNDGANGTNAAYVANRAAPAKQRH